MSERAFLVPNPPTPNDAVRFDDEICIGCNRCVAICRSDVLAPSPERGGSPIVVYPDECWYCGACVLECAHPGAVTLVHPLNQRVSVVWKRGGDGSVHRLGAEDPHPA